VVSLPSMFNTFMTRLKVKPVADNSFLMLHMPSVMKRLSYRILGTSHPSRNEIENANETDVSTVKVSPHFFIFLFGLIPAPSLTFACNGH
jgi:hypothetical protein